MPKNRTVLISGLGIAGPTLAYWLKLGGFEPTLVERAPQLRTGGYVIDFWGLGYDIAERMKLTANIQRIGYQARELRVVNSRGNRVAGFGINVFRELTGGRYVTIPRSELSRLLFESLGNTTEVLFSNEIVGLNERPDRVGIQFKDGQERKFDLVIGADGLHSQLRKLAFGPQQSFEKQLVYAVAAFEVEGYRPRDEDVYVTYGKPGRMLGRFTLRHNKTLILFVFATGNEILPDTVEGQRKLLRTHYGDGKWECPQILTALDETQELYFDRVSQIRMPRWSHGRIGLVGDAAFCVSLLAGQGSALAMISAYVLAGELTRPGIRHEEAFRRYEAFLRAFIGAKQRGAERFAGALAPQTQWGLWFRNQVINSFAIPGIAKMAFGREITDSLRLREYDWESRVPPTA